mmetsp:Transcript_18736/g.56578  ORF Transcript_18736/g.56578 Transcript_18736/m.56578 type:complete len:219 (+) Transcript_18736:1056-1712(+)
MPSPMSRKAVATRQDRMTFLNSLVSSTSRPKAIPPSTMAIWNPAPARSICMPSTKPARASAGAMNADTTFVQAIDATNVAVAIGNPGRRRRSMALLGYSSCNFPRDARSRSRSSSSARAAMADADGGVVGLSLKKNTVAKATATEKHESTSKYECMPAGVLAMTPPTMNAVAMPTWLKLIAVAVARARSEDPNHVAESNGGEHWKKGWAMPTRMVPAI